eukprot:542103_1
MSLKDEFITLGNLPKLFKYDLPTLLCYPRNSNWVIISTDCDETDAGIYKYNMITNKLELLQNYDGINNPPDFHGQFINRNVLCIFGGSHCSLITYDLLNSTITTNKTNISLCDIQNLDECPKCVNIFSNKTNHIHILHQCNHFIYDCNINKEVKVEIDCNILKTFKIKFPKLLYSESTQQLMILGADDSDRIFTCDIEENQQSEYKWILNEKIKMPRMIEDERGYNYVLVNDVIIVFYFDCDYGSNYNDIWCLDLWCHKWFKSKYITPESVIGYARCIKSNDNNVHVLDFESKYHFKVDIWELFPKDMIIERRKRHNTLIMGYIKEQENSLLLNMPFVLKQLILCYFQLFG